MEGKEGGREGRAWSGLCTEACQTVVVSIHSALTCCREGLRAVRGGNGRAREGGMDQLLLLYNVIKIKCILTLHQHYTVSK